jgi:hypothetical protein
MSTREPLRISSAFEDENQCNVRSKSAEEKDGREKEKGATEGGVDG